MRALAANALLAMRLLKAQPESQIAFFIAPLWAVVFVLIFRSASAGGAGSDGVIAPGLMGLWTLALYNCGLIISVERWAGTLELQIAAPARFATVIFGRITITMLLGVGVFVETWAVGRVLIGREVDVAHPMRLGLTLALTLFATASAAGLMSCLFALARTALNLANSLTYPLYVLGGVLAPISVLPGWLQPVSRVIFLSWSAILMRSCFETHHRTDVVGACLALAGLGVAMFAMAMLLLRRVSDVMRRNGKLGFT